MSVASACPSFRELHRLMMGQASPEEADQLSRHLRDCASCAEAYQTFRIQRTVITELPPALRKGASSGSSHGPEYLAPAVRASATLQRPEPAPTRRTPESEVVVPRNELQQVCALLAPPQQSDEMGRLGPYRVLKALGAGGMGIVFQAEDPQLKRAVALKVLKPLSEGGEESRQRFLREARAAAALEHEHIVTIYQVGEDRGVPFMAMQLLLGETLEDRLDREHKLPALEIVRIGREIAEGLAAAHERGMIHRDIKPSNIWLEAGRGRVKIVDFGLVRSAHEDQHLTKTGAVMGTPAYMAPEQARGIPLDFRCDLYSLGCVLYHMTTGRTPFLADDTMALLLALAHEQPPPVQVFNPKAPPLLIGLIQRLLSKVPQGRPPTAAAVVEVLETLEHQINNSMKAGGTGLEPEPGTVAPRRRAGVLVQLVLLVTLCGGGYFAFPVVMDLLSNKGHLVVVSDDPGTRVVVKQNGRTVVDATASRKIELAPGVYDIELAGAGKGVRLSKNQFALERGSRVSVKVEQTDAKSK